MKRYEQATRVITAFFSVLLGLGLKNLLDRKAFGPANAGWPCFLMSVFLFLRFLLGSSNHMWFEFVRLDRTERQAFPVSRFRIFNDFFSLVILGLVGVAICYSTTVDEFLDRNLLLTGLGVVWVFLYIFVGWVKKRPSGKRERPAGKWDYWLWINLTQFSSILVVHCLVIPKDWGVVPRWLSFCLPGPAWDWSLFILVVVYMGVFTWDFSKQLEILDDSHNQVTPAAGNPL